MHHATTNDTNSPIRRRNVTRRSATNRSRTNRPTRKRTSAMVVKTCFPKHLSSVFVSPGPPTKNTSDRLPNRRTARSHAPRTARALSAAMNRRHPNRSDAIAPCRVPALRVARAVPIARPSAPPNRRQPTNAHRPVRSGRARSAPCRRHPHAATAVGPQHRHQPPNDPAIRSDVRPHPPGMPSATAAAPVLAIVRRHRAIPTTIGERHATVSTPPNALHHHATTGDSRRRLHRGTAVVR